MLVTARAAKSDQCFLLDVTGSNHESPRVSWRPQLLRR
jgi:hypothetical protein